MLLANYFALGLWVVVKAKFRFKKHDFRQLFSAKIKNRIDCIYWRSRAPIVFGWRVVPCVVV